MNWHILFQIGAYGSLIACGYHAVSYLNSEGFWKVFRELLLLAAFVLAYWLLESYATHVSDYYFYPPAFSDMIPYFSHWNLLPFLPDPGLVDPCGHKHTDIGISLSVPLMEATLTYSMMWTVRLFAGKAPIWIWPFAVGLAMLAVDLFLDPVVALSHDCGSGSVTDEGVGFWEWYANREMGVWYHWIPMFNWLAWYAAPIALVAFVLLIRWARDFLVYLQGETTPSGITALVLDGILRAILTIAFFLLFGLAPVHPGDNILMEAMIFLSILVFSIALLWSYRNQYVHTYAVRRYWQLLVPQFGFHIIALLVTLLSGFHSVFPWLLFWLVLAALGVWYAITPYWKP